MPIRCSVSVRSMPSQHARGRRSGGRRRVEPDGAHATTLPATHRDALAAADRAGGEAERASSAASMREARRSSRIAPDAPHGWPSPIAPPSRADPVLVQAEVVDHGEDARRERLGDLHGADVGDGMPRARASAARDRRRRRRPGRAGSAGRPRMATTRSPGRPAGAHRRSSPPRRRRRRRCRRSCRRWPCRPAPNAGRSRPSRVARPGPARGRSSRATPSTGTISASNTPACWAADGALVRARRVLVLARRGPRRSGGERVGGLAHVGVRPAGRARTAPGCSAGGLAVAGRAARTATARCWRTRPRRRGSARRRPRELGWRPAATASSPEPHCRSTVTPGTLSPSPARSAGDPRDVAAGPEAVAEDDVVDRRAPTARRRRATAASTGAASASTVWLAMPRPTAADRRALARRRCTGASVRRSVTVSCIGRSPPDRRRVPGRERAARARPAAIFPDAVRGSAVDDQPPPRATAAPEPARGQSDPAVPRRAPGLDHGDQDLAQCARMGRADHGDRATPEIPPIVASTSSASTVTPPTFTAASPRPRTPVRRPSRSARGRPPWRSRRRRARSDAVAPA